METVNKKGIIDQAIVEIALDKLQKIKLIADRYQTNKIVGIATEAFRVAKNGPEVIKLLSDELGFKISIIDQYKEGELGYLTFIQIARQSGLISSVVSWDTGKGSEQLSMRDEMGEMHIYKTKLGYTICSEQIFAKQIRKIEPRESYNPISQDEIDQLVSILNENETEIPPQWLREAALTTHVVRLYTTTLFPTLFGVDEKPKVSLAEVKHVISRMVNKTDSQIEMEFGKSLPYLGHLPLYIAMLQATMERIGIPEITYVYQASSTGNTQGMLLSQDLFSDD